MPRATPAAIIRPAVSPDDPAYVVVRPGPCATASAPHPDAATANPGTTQAACLHHAVGGVPRVGIEVIVGPRIPPATPC